MTVSFTMHAIIIVVVYGMSKINNFSNISKESPKN